MKKNAFYLYAMLIGFVFAFASCDDDEEEIFQIDPDEDEFDARLVSDASDSTTAVVFVSDVTDGTIDVLVTFRSDGNMRRVYATKNELAAGEEPFDFSLEGAETKADGSLELGSGSRNSFTLNLDFATANLPSDGTIVYRFWATSGKGDHRDDTKRLVEGPLTLTINLGGVNPATPLISTSDVQLFAPTADLMSKSFVSTLDGRVYALNEFEFSDLWDIGYTAQDNKPRLTSASGSPQQFSVDGSIITFKQLIENELGEEAAEDLNMVYFVDIDDTFDFDGASTVEDLNSLTPSISDPQTIDIPLTASGDIIAFRDQYGKIGVIRIDALVDGDEDDNYFESNDYVQIDIKVQP